MEKILIIDDDVTFSLMLRTWLGKKGFGVDTAADIAAGRRLLAEGSYDLVLSDMRLPRRGRDRSVAVDRRTGRDGARDRDDRLCRNPQCRGEYEARREGLCFQTRSAGRAAPQDPRGVGCPAPRNSCARIRSDGSGARETASEGGQGLERRRIELHRRAQRRFA